MNTSCLRMSSASSERPAKAITSAEDIERAMRLDSYDLYDTDMALLVAPVRRIMRPSCEDKSALLAYAASLCAKVPS